MGFLDDIFGGGTETTKTTIDRSNPYILGAINRADTLSKTGLSDDILSKMRRRVRMLGDRQNSALRSSTASRLRRGGATRQEQEQILSDLSSKQLGEVENSLLGVDFANEEQKMQALQLLGQFSSGLTERRTSKTQRPGGLGLGQLLGKIFPGIESLFSQGGTNNSGTPPIGFSNPKYLPPIGQ